MKLKVYSILSDAVEQGLAYGYRRAHKHTDTPVEANLLDTIHTAVMSELCEVIDFDHAEEVCVTAQTTTGALPQGDGDPRE